MSFEELRLLPGIDVERTPTANQANYVDGAFIRWKEGMVEKMGGWVRFYPTSIAAGVPRALHPWQDINGNNRLAIGGTTALKIITSGTLTDITPQEAVTNSAPNFSTVINTTTVTIVDAGFTNPTTFDAIYISTPVSIGGIILQGLYPITLVTGANTYQIQSAVPATSTVNNAGAVPSYTTASGTSQVTVTLNNHGFVAGSIFNALISTTGSGVTIFGSYPVVSATTNTFVINVAQVATGSTTFSENAGNANITYFVALGPQATSSGWGVGTWGSGGWGTGTTPTAGTGTPITATDYSLLNFGEVLIANPAGGPLFQWGPEAGIANASVITQGPIIADGCILTQPQQIIIAWGASFTGAKYPLRLVWSDAGNFTVWTPTATNFAGGFTVARGSAILSVLQGANQFLVLTDVGALSGQYINQPLVFSIIEIMTGCGIVGRKAGGVANTSFYWMSQTQLYQMAAGGVPMPMRCTIWDTVFQQIDKANVSKVRFFANSQFNEIGWYFPLIGGNGENSRYIKMNTIDGIWDTGPMGRAAWIDQSLLGSPIGADQTGLIFQHEIGYDADGVAMNPFVVTGDYAINKGEDFGFIDYMIPDAWYGPKGQPQTATMLYTVTAKDFPNDPNQRVSGPFTATVNGNFIEPRVRGRQANFRVESQDLGSFWRLGLVRHRVAADGRNPI